MPRSAHLQAREKQEIVTQAMARSLLLTTTFLLATSATFYGGVGGADANVIDTVAETCNAIRKFFMDFDFCVSRLRSVPGSASADRHTHFLMATDLATVSACGLGMGHGDKDGS